MRYKDLKKENKVLWNLIELQNSYIQQMANELDQWYYQYYGDKYEYEWE